MYMRINRIYIEYTSVSNKNIHKLNKTIQLFQKYITNTYKYMYVYSALAYPAMKLTSLNRTLQLV